MNFSVCVAAGARAIREMDDEIARRGLGSALTVVRAGDVLVAWQSGTPWVQSRDDGDVLVVVDGHLHNAWPPGCNPSDAVWNRYREHGLDVAQGLLGDFVIVVLDRAKTRLVVARDPVGVRPWYYSASNGRYVGATDIATPVAVPWVDTSVNERVAVQYLAAIEESTGETLYHGVHTLRPGQTWSSMGGVEAVFAHHRWEIEPELEISWDDAVDRCRDVLTECVRSRVDACGSASSHVSGGLDSSAIVGTAAKLGRTDLLVGRLVFDTPRADERTYSDAVIEHWGVRAVSASPWIPTSDDRERLAESLARPVPDANFTMFMSLHRRFIEQGRRDALTGLGGDDAFVASSVGPRVVSALRLRRKDVLQSLVPRSRGEVKAFLTDVARPTVGYFLPPRRGHGYPSWVRAGAIRAAGLHARLRRRAEKVTGIASIDERLAALTSGYDAAVLETAAAVRDVVGMRESHPFLDPRFIRATYGLDPWWPLRDGHDRALEVAAFRDRLPKVVAERRSKADFSEVFWPQVLDQGALDGVRSGPLAEAGWLDREGFEALVGNANRGMANAAIPLFRCIALDRWVRAQR